MNMDRELPLLREELALFPGPKARNGAPTWSLHDPASNRFFRIGWREFEVLRRWPLRQASQVATTVSAETTLTITVEQVWAIAQFLTLNQLITPQSPEDQARLLQQTSNRHPWFIRLLHNYLFFRIPLLHPDRFLERLLPALRWCFTPLFWLTLFLSSLVGLYLVTRRWDAFLNTFSYLFTWQGTLIFMGALFLVKVAHELGHALTAKYFGCRVPTMGVAFLVMWPMLYTETSEAWKLPAQKQRLAIGAAGILAELMLAVMATLAWSFLTDGPLRSAMFFVATLSWIMTLGFNLNPFMRFDGYFMLSDLLEIQNLHSRASALGRWRLREFLLNLGDAPPEQLSSKERRFMILFAYATWLYRFFLFLGIALLVYHFFTKVVGLFLMLVEVGWFIILPIFKEFKVWYERRETWHWGFSTLRSLLFLLLGITVIFIPWRSEWSAPGVLQRLRHTVLYAPAPARVELLPFSEGDRVAKGETLAVLTSPDLEQQIAQTRRDILLLRWQLSFSSVNHDLLENNLIVQRELQSKMSAYEGALRQKKRLVLVAPFAGRVVARAEHLEVGHWVTDKEPLLSLVDETGWKVEAYLGEEDLERVQHHTRAVFYPEGLDWPRLPCRVSSLDPMSVPHLTETAVASIYGGAVPVRQDGQGALIPGQGFFRIQLHPETAIPDLQQVLRGTVVLSGAPQTLFSRLWRTAVMGVVRESGF